MSGTFTSVCVYCGSSPGADPRFGRAAAKLGELIAERQLRLVYGGGHVGLMGILADSVLANGGEVHGVITRALEGKEVAHTSLTKLDVVDTMHERKARMADLADGFVMLPGGFGTLDEYFEALTWTQLGVHAKPCSILDVGGYFEPLIAFIRSATKNRFVRAEHRDMIITGTDPASVLDKMISWTRPTSDKWLDRRDR